MPTPYQVTLTSDREIELVRTREHAPQPYLRERAAVLLKIAAGSPSATPQPLAASNRTIVIASATGWPGTRGKNWRDCWSARGVGASPPPVPQPTEQAQHEVQETLQRAPRLLA